MGLTSNKAFSETLNDLIPEMRLSDGDSFFRQ